MAAANSSVDDFDVALLNTIPIVPEVFKLLRGTQVAMVFSHSRGKFKKNKVFYKAREFDRCKECSNRASCMFNLSDINGPLFSFNKDCDKYKSLYDIADTACKNDIETMVCVEQYLPEVGGFHHWYRSVSHSTSDGVNVESINYVVHRYGKSLRSLVEKIGDGGIRSLKLMRECLNEAVYGNKFIPALDWLMNILIDKETTEFKTDKDFWRFYCKHILLSPISKDSNGWVCTFYHTANGNIVDLLETANTKEEMVDMVEDRLNPANYQRRSTTAELSDKIIDNAIKVLGDFTNTVMTKEEAGKMEHVVTLTDDTSALDGMKKMKSKKDMSHAGGFADRAGDITSIDKLIEYLRENPSSTLSVDPCTLNVVYVANTTLPKNIVSFPHLWLYDPNFTRNEWVDVSQLIPMYKYIQLPYRNFMFVVDSYSAKYRHKLKNCCLPVFLNTSHTRVYGKVFEKLNTTTNVKYPSEDELMAVGVGGSAINDINDIKPLKIKLNGREMTITKLK